MSKKFEYQNPEPDAFMPYVLWLGIIVVGGFILGSAMWGYYTSRPSEKLKQDQQAIMSKIAETNEQWYSKDSTTSNEGR